MSIQDEPSSFLWYVPPPPSFDQEEDVSTNWWWQTGGGVQVNKIKFRSGGEYTQALTFESALPSLLETPFNITDRAQFDKARKLFNEGVSGWSMELLESLGLLKLPAEGPGGCLGCMFSSDVLFWILDSVNFEGGNTGSTFSGEELSISMDHDAESDNNAMFSYDFVKRNLLAAFDRLNANPSLLVIAIKSGINWSMTNAHATVTLLCKSGDKRKITWFDPNGVAKSSVLASELIKEFLVAERPSYEYEIEYPRCDKFPQISEMYKVPYREPEGYCQTWSAIVLILTLASDGSSLDRILEDLTRYIKPGTIAVTNLVRTVSKNAARLVREQGNLSVKLCSGLTCCLAESYCSPTISNIKLTFKEKTLFLADRQGLVTYHPRSIQKFMFLSNNGFFWFSYEGFKMIGLRFSRVGSDPFFKENFESYLVALKSLGSLSLTPTSHGFFENEAQIDERRYDVAFVVLPFSLYSLKTLFTMAPSLKLADPLPQIVSSQLASLNLGSLLTLNDMYGFVLSGEIRGPYFLDADLIQEGPVDIEKNKKEFTEILERELRGHLL
jgi:hypothetical protein